MVCAHGTALCFVFRQKDFYLGLAKDLALVSRGSV